MAKNKYWHGSEPKCDFYGLELPKLTSFVDSKTVHGPWAIMCPGCHNVNGVGFGLGKGQGYERQIDGQFKKVAG